MNPSEVFNSIQSYLQLTDLQEKDHLFRKIRRMVELPELTKRYQTHEELTNLLLNSNFTQSNEGKALVTLLRGYIMATIYQHQEALKHFDEALSHVSGQEESTLIYLLCRARLARIYSLTETGMNRQSLNEAKEIEPLIKKLDLPALHAEHAHIRGLAHRRLGENQAAKDSLRAALEHSQNLRDEWLIARVEDTLGLTCLDMGEMDQSELHLQRSLARKTRLGDQVGLARTLGNLGRYYATQEKDDLAFTYLMRELDLCEELGNIKGSMVSLRELSQLALRAKRWAQAEDYLKRAEGLVKQVGSLFSEAYLALSWADFYLARGELQQADEQHQIAVSKFGSEPGDLIQAHLKLQAARIAASRSDKKDAEETFQAAKELFERINRPVYLARAEFDWGMWLAQEQRLDEAAFHISNAINYAQTLQAKNIVQRFADTCKQINSEQWLQALCKLKEASEELSTEKARFEKLAEQIIHDLKNKMIVMNWALQKIEKKTHNESDPSRYLTDAQSLSHYLENLLKSYLNGLKLEEGRLPLSSKPLELNSFFQELKEVFAIPLEEKKLELILSSGPPDLKVQANDLLFRLILFNLLDNAVKYTPSNQGSIRVEVTVEPDFARICISDPGEGIPEQLQERIFKKWGRVEREEVSYSTGLGLYHTKMMVEAMGGQIGVNSIVGQGSTFWFTVPLADQGEN
jgi:signal transduction histidine kinase